MTELEGRRTESRIPEKTTIFLETMSCEGENYQPRIIICNSLDISANGIQVQVDEMVVVGSILRLCAGVLNQDLFLVSEVMWVKEDGSQFNIGLAIFEADDTDIIAWKKLIASKLNVSCELPI